MSFFAINDKITPFPRNHKIKGMKKGTITCPFFPKLKYLKPNNNLIT